MAESDPYFKNYQECEELYVQAKYTECTKLALDNLMGTCLSFQNMTERVPTVVSKTQQILPCHATSSSRRFYYSWAQRTTAGAKQRYITIVC